jgi:hypothetical protein
VTFQIKGPNIPTLSPITGNFIIKVGSSPTFKLTDPSGVELL